MTAASPRVAPSGLTVDVSRESPLWEAEPGAEAVVRRAISQAAAVAGAAAPVRGGRGAAVRRCRDRGAQRPVARTRRADQRAVVPGAAGRSRIGARDRGAVHLGDIAIACETVMREAREQGRTVSPAPRALAVHGFLHLLGYDHEPTARPSRWKRLEREILAGLGISDPYAAALMLETGCHVRQFCRR